MTVAVTTAATASAQEAFMGRRYGTMATMDNEPNQPKPLRADGRVYADHLLHNRNFTTEIDSVTSSYPETTFARCTGGPCRRRLFGRLGADRLALLDTPPGFPGGSEQVVLGVEAAQHAAEAPHRARPHEGGPAAVVEVPAPAAAAGPHRAIQVFADPPHVAVLRVGSHLKARQVPLAHHAQGVHDIGRLRLGFPDHRAVPRAGPCAAEVEEVREPRDGGRPVEPGSTVPKLVYGSAVAAPDAREYRRFRRLEARREDYGVDLTLGAVLGDKASLPRLPHGAGDELDVGLRDGGVEVVGYEDALAADLVVGCELGTQLRVADMLLQQPPGRLLQEPAQNTVAPDHAVVHQVAHRELAKPVEPNELRERPQHALLLLQDLPIRAGHNPPGSTLEDHEAPDPRLYLRNDLDRRGPRPDDGDALAGEVVFVVPAARVERLTSEAIQTRHVREDGLGERPGARYEHVRAQTALRRNYAPRFDVVVPRRIKQLLAQGDPEPQSPVPYNRFKVVFDLRPRRERPVPLRVRGKGERVQVRRHVARHPRVQVVPPDPADAFAPLQDNEVFLPALPQTRGDGESAEARADNDLAQVAPGSPLATADLPALPADLRTGLDGGHAATPSRGRTDGHPPFYYQRGIERTNTMLLSVRLLREGLGTKPGRV